MAPDEPLCAPAMYGRSARGEGSIATKTVGIGTETGRSGQAQSLLRRTNKSGERGWYALARLGVHSSRLQAERYFLTSNSASITSSGPPLPGVALGVACGPPWAPSPWTYCARLCAATLRSLTACLIACGSSLL